MDERKLMLQWWADLLDANREKVVTLFDYAEIEGEMASALLISTLLSRI